MMKTFVAAVSLISTTYAIAAAPVPVPHKPKTVMECIYAIDERTGPDMQGFTASGDFAMNLPKNTVSTSDVQFAKGYILQLSYQQDGWLVAAVYKNPSILLGYTSVASQTGPISMTIAYDDAIPGFGPLGRPFSVDLSCWPELR